MPHAVHMAATDMTRPNTPERSAAATLRGLFPYLWPRNDPRTRLRVVCVCVLLVLAKIATIGVPYAYSRVIDALQPVVGKAAMMPLVLIVGYGLLRMAAAALGELRDALFAPLRYRISRIAAMRSFTHMHQLSLRFHLNRQSGGVTQAIARGTEAIETVLRVGVFNVVPTMIEALMVIVVIWRLFDWRYAVVMLAAVAAYVVFTIQFTSWRIGLRRRMNAINSEAGWKALDSLLNYETVKYFGNEEHERKRYEDAQRRYERAAVRTQISLNGLNFGQAAIIAIALITVMLMAGHDVETGRMTVGRFVLVNTYLTQLYLPLNFLGSVYSSLRNSLVDLEHMFALMDEQADITDSEGAISLPARLDEAPAADIRFEDVHFSYHPDREILRGVSFHVPAGHRVAIVGPTGAGKSTISRLLFRFYDVTAGRILIDGHDIRQCSQAALRGAVGVVPQDTVLFNDTIGYNIAYGRLGATQAEIEQAAKLACIHDFIVTLPEGYATRVGERGLKLSGGEKQRVAIARTILKNPRVLLLDEATSALDTRTEQEIQTALHTVAANRTTIIIAHRLSTIIDVDEILVMGQGRILERGTHRALLEHGGQYAQMWAAQAEEDAAEP
ncbi:Putative multidrug export ATP-binding/permease protein [Komagataeibacter saccharivorans]|uniref:Multidrug export ATP-binding/permease protein n=1 Tax=Komagataeibacter saccharivorans TaxID=265959 RepID=A0A347WD08_9PROT|nr:ABC transporter ATP-binding protein/permease [Komagataeibacter saccharivorans]AXY22751.1 Putative multidrug export ATP-binding/permease protein [Komagataeibacter saccharivorans]PYD51933.1 metal ABC transporter permease [Komagataeibacter saccharivorans]